MERVERKQKIMEGSENLILRRQGRGKVRKKLLE